jgi:hypothetical protein
MANNIDNTSSFTTSNMKPSADEETAALWGQNIAENTGYLYHQKDTISFAPLVQGTTVLATGDGDWTYSSSNWHLLKAHQDTIDGTFTSRWESDGVDITGTFAGTFSVDGSVEDTEYTSFAAQSIDEINTKKFTSNITPSAVDRWIELNYTLYVSGTSAFTAYTLWGTVYDQKFTAYKS